MQIKVNQYEKKIKCDKQSKDEARERVKERCETLHDMKIK